MYIRAGIDDAEFPERLGRISKLVVTTNKELYERLEEEKLERKRQLMRKYM